MIKADKTLDKMRNNPRDWQIADLEVIAGRSVLAILTIPANRPVKSIYIKKFVSLIDALQEEEI